METIKHYRQRRPGFPSLTGNGIIDDTTPVLLADQLFASYMVADWNQTSNYQHANTQEFSLFRKNWGEGSADEIKKSLESLFLDFFPKVDLSVRQRSKLERDPDLISIEISMEVTSSDGQVTDLSKVFSINTKSASGNIARDYNDIGSESDG